jgi:hypothetical protein
MRAHALCPTFGRCVVRRCKSYQVSASCAKFVGLEEYITVSRGLLFHFILTYSRLEQSFVVRWRPFSASLFVRPSSRVAAWRIAVSCYLKTFFDTVQCCDVLYCAYSQSLRLLPTCSQQVSMLFIFT